MQQSAPTACRTAGKAIYGRAGPAMPALRSRALIRARGQGDDNRTTYWCPSCQR